MLFTEFNMEEALQVRGEEQYAVGKAAGLAEGETIGLAKGKASEIRIIRNKLSKHKSVPEIAELLELAETYITQIAELIHEYPDDTDVQIAERYFKATT